MEKLISLNWIFFILQLAVFGTYSIAKPVDSTPIPKKRDSKIQYPERTQLEFDRAQIEGELKKPGEFYFQHRSQEKFDSFVKPRKNFHKEMLRDVVLSK